jgi:hypothetical protein
MGGNSGDVGGGSVHLHGWCFGREWRVDSRAGGENEAFCLYRLSQGRTRGTRGEDARAVQADAFRAQI